MRFVKQHFIAVVTLGLAGACVLAVLLATAALRSQESDEAMQEFSSETTDPDALESNAEITFPPSANNVIGYITGFPDITTYVRFEIASSDLAAFLDGTLCETELEPTQAPAQQEFEMASISWWDSHEAKAIMSCSGSRSDFGQQIWVSMADPSVYVIYVFAGTT